MKGHIRPGNAAGTWYLRVELPRSANGSRRQRRLTLRGTKADAQRKLRELLHEIETGGTPIGDRISFDAVLDKWLDSRRHRVARRTIHAYDVHVRLYLKPALGSLRATALRPQHIETAIAQWSSASRIDGSAPLSQRTVRHLYDTLRACCRWAVAMGYLPKSPIERVESPKFERHEILPLDPVGVAELLTAAEGTALQAPILICAGTGLRRSELLALQWSDIDLERASLTVNRSLDRSLAGVLRVRPPKTEKSRRTISLAGFVVQALRSHRLAQLERFLEIGIPVKKDGWVFDRPDHFDGEPWDPDEFSKTFARLVSRSNVPQTTFHGLRHAYATIALRAGVDLKTVSVSLGHSEIGTTANLYTHIVEALKRDAADRVENAFGEAVGGVVLKGSVPQRCQSGPRSATPVTKKARGYRLRAVSKPQERVGFESTAERLDEIS